MVDRSPYLFGPRVEPRSASLPTLSDRETLGRRLLLSARVRYAVSAAFVLLPWSAVLLGALDLERAMVLTVAGVVLGFYNSAFYAHAIRNEAPERSAVAFGSLRLTLFTGVAVDYVVLAVVVAFFGGVRGPFTPFYLLHVVMNGLLLSRRVAVGFTGLAYFLIAAQVGAELMGVTPGTLGRALPPLDGTTALLTLALYAALFGLTDLLVISLVEWLRRSERQLRETNLRLDRLSRLRRDFLHLAVHNLRAPVGAAQMHVENMVAGLGGSDPEKERDRLLRIGHRLEGLQEMLQDLRLLGDLETEDVAASARAVPVGELLEEVVEEWGDQAAMVGLELRVELERPSLRVRAIRRLLREAVVNYVTNAVKYAPRSGPVELAARGTPDGDIRIEVRDRGPGVAEEARPHLFRELEGPEPDVSAGLAGSSGLGLSLVRRIVEAHGGRVGVEAAEGEGSVFWMELPAA